VTWVADPVRHLLFVNSVKLVNNAQVATTLVIQDTTPSGASPPPEDYDALTSNLPEGPKTLTTFSGTSAGYGANLVYVGGTGGATAPLYQGLLTASELFVPRNSIVSPGDRGVTLASVPFLDLRNVDASATAQQIAPDTSTDNDRRTYQNQIISRGEALGQGDAAAQVGALLDWRWPASACLDPGGEPGAPSATAPGGEASAGCDLDKLHASASASEGAVQTDGLTIAGSTMTSEATKEAGGLATTSVSGVKGIDVEVPGEGRLRIGSIVLEVHTTAHGHAGTAHTSWSREIKGAVITDAQGKQIFGCDVCDADTLAKQVNDLFDLKLRMRVPTPEITETRRGAFAGFTETEADHINNVVAMNESNNSRIMPALQLEIYNDLSDRSRLVLQLAGIQANSIYGITPLAGEPPIDVIPPLPTVGPIPQPDLHAQPPAPKQQTDDRGGFIKRLVTTARFLVRSPKDALLVGLTGLLFFAMAAVAIRRRQLNTLTIGGPFS
jgi:hypothetical protein